MSYRLPKVIILGICLCCLSVVHADELICRSKDASGGTVYEPCGSNPDPSTIVDSKITITKPLQPVKKPDADKNRYSSVPSIPVKPVATEEAPPDEPDEDTEELLPLEEEIDTSDEVEEGGATVIPRTLNRPDRKKDRQPKPVAPSEE